jgi:asparagine synthase (glutamine-hydrolysing)
VISNSDIAAAFPDAVRHAEVPVFRTALAPMYLLSRAVHEEGIKVVLSGEGADEVFLGYDIFKEAQLRATVSGGTSPEETMRLVAALYPHESHLHAGQASPLSALFAQFADRIDDPLFSHHLRFHNSSFTTRLLPHPPDDSLEKLREWMSAEIPSGASWPVMARAQWLEFRTLLAGYLLSSQGDRASMAHSVEVRCPFLDSHVVESASRLPLNLLLHPSGEEKHVLRAAFADLLPGSIVSRGKQAYRSPDAKVFQDTRPDYVESILSEAEIQSMGIFDPRFASRLANKVMNAAGPVSPRESQTFVFLLSTALVYRFFCRREASVDEPIDHLFRTIIDGRQSLTG